MSIHHYIVLPIVALLLQPIATERSTAEAASSIESVVPNAASTDVYFKVTVGVADYFSHAVSLPYTDDELTYADAGKQALAAAKQRFANQVARHAESDVSVQSVHAVRQQHYTSEQFEGERLRDVRRSREITNGATYVL